jgi:hypothetical protein
MFFLLIKTKLTRKQNIFVIKNLSNTTQMHKFANHDQSHQAPWGGQWEKWGEGGGGGWWEEEGWGDGIFLMLNTTTINTRILILSKVGFLGGGRVVEGGVEWGHLVGLMF